MKRNRKPAPRASKQERLLAQTCHLALKVISSLLRPNTQALINTSALARCSNQQPQLKMLSLSAGDPALNQPNSQLLL